MPAWAPVDYRPDIDGLRAVAILLTLGFHAFPEWMPSGYVGVDVFFVISGYVITRQLHREWRVGRFRLAHFYARRIRRIFPAAALVLAVVLAWGALSLYPDEYQRLGRHAAAAAGFVANWALWSDVGYFDTAAQTKHLLHFWSLAVEEQFYLLWPCLALAWLRWPRVVVPGTLLLALASLLAFLVTGQQQPALAFYAAHTRFWELAVGCALALRGGTAPAGLLHQAPPGPRESRVGPRADWTLLDLGALMMALWPTGPATEGAGAGAGSLASLQA